MSLCLSINQSLNLHRSQISKMFILLSKHSVRLRLVVDELKVYSYSTKMFSSKASELEFLFAERKLVLTFVYLIQFGIFKSYIFL